MLFTSSAILLLSSTVVSQPRVWLTCPPSFDMSLSRAGINSGPCETFNPGNSFVQNVTAGSRLKVGWLSGNRGGGYVKLSMAPGTENIQQSSFDSNVLKVTCFGFDQRPNRFSFGSCNHACNARGGCAYQSNITDVERFDTTITVPYNVDGLYYIQLQAYVGVSLSPVYSCAAINVIGGDTSLSCSAPAAIPVVESCESVSSITSNDLTTGTTPGPFCYSPDGSAAGIDDNIVNIPINSECDPRVSCSFANLAQLCQADITQTILDPTVSPHVSSCSLTAWVPPTSTVAIPTTTTTIEITSTTTSTTTTFSATTTTSVDVATISEDPLTGIQTTVDVLTISEAPVTTIDTPASTSADVPVSTEASLTGTDVLQTTVDLLTTSDAPVTTSDAVITTDASAATSAVIPVTTEAPFTSTDVPTSDPPTSTISDVPSTTTLTTNCVSLNSVLPPATACDATSVQRLCSGVQLAFCAQYESLTGYYGQYLFSDCPAGTVCDESCGHPVCSFASDNVCPPYVPPVLPTQTPSPPYTEGSNSGSSSVPSSGPVYDPSGSPSSSGSSPGPASDASNSPSSSGLSQGPVSDPSSSPSGPGSSPGPVSDPYSPPSGSGSSPGPASDASNSPSSSGSSSHPDSSSSSGSGPSSSSGSSSGSGSSSPGSGSTSGSGSSTPTIPKPDVPAPPPYVESAVTTTCVDKAEETEYSSQKCYPQIDVAADCDVATAPITCSGTHVAQCASAVINGTVVGRWTFTSCGKGTECRLYSGVPTCDYTYKPCSF